MSMPSSGAIARWACPPGCLPSSMIVGLIPLSHRTSAAVIPAGPAPTMMTSAMVGPSGWRRRADGHGFGHRGGAGAQPGPICEPDPAILAGAHQAEACPRLAAEFVASQGVANQQNGCQYGLTLAGFGGRTV